jgi:hypothetical protein
MTGNLTLTALRDSGFQDALEARRMAILAAIETPDHEDNHELLEELKQITHAMANAVLSLSLSLSLSLTLTLSLSLYLNIKIKKTRNRTR